MEHLINILNLVLEDFDDSFYLIRLEDDYFELWRSHFVLLDKVVYDLYGVDSTDHAQVMDRSGEQFEQVQGSS